MNTRILLIALFMAVANSLAAQQTYIDSLHREIYVTDNDTTRLILLEKIANVYSEINPDSAYHYAAKFLAITQKLNLKLEEVVALGEMGYAMLNMGNNPRSLQYLLSGIAIAQDEQSEKNILPVRFPATDDFTDRTVPARLQRLAKQSRIMQYAGILYGNSGNYEKAVYYFKAAIPLAEEAGNLRVLSITYTTLGRTYGSQKKQDSALLCLQSAYGYAIKADYNRYVGSILLNMGRVYLALGKQDSAKAYFHRALFESNEHNYFRGVVASYLVLAEMYKKSGYADSSLYFMKKGLAVANQLNAPDLYLRTYTALADYYNSRRESDSTVKYQALIIKINDSLFNSKQVQQFQNIDYDAQQREQEIENAKKEYQNRMQKYFLIGGLFFLLALAVFLLRNNRNRKRTNAILQRQNTEIEIAMNNLKATQAQLIQSEKMASLGELTAGIAHEIQNPLNFVNNFSELNKELLEDLKIGIDKGNLEEVKSLANDVMENQEKINHHGKRADSIVKGMLQHSQRGSSAKEPTDINILADEYLRLAFHGFRAKENNFNTTIRTALDQSIGTVNIIPQDIGRVILNLINNAFYAVNKKSKEGIAGYEPVVEIGTKRVGGNVEIRVKDNGSGIPENIKSKIFQPFFTTKPTGQGTGLGLSLSYDIIKAHGGALKVASKEGEGSEFIISIPGNLVS
jgi:signal transduction histidine kinase